jgi:hypothetical protein
MTYKDIANSVSKFGGILFTPIELTVVACYASGPMKVRLLFRSQNVPPPPPKPLHRHWYICRHLVTMHFSHLTNRLCGCVTACFDFRLLWGSLWVQISTLSYEAKTLSWPERLPVAYYSHVIQTKVMLKNRDTHKYWCLQLQEGSQTCLL